MKLPLVLKLLITALLFMDSLNASPKYSTQVDKIKTTISKGPQPPPLPTGHVKKYVDFDLKSQGSRYGKEEHHHYGYGSYDGNGGYGGHGGLGGHGGYGHYEHYYPSYDYGYSGKGHEYGYLLPYVIGGVGILMLPIITLMLTLAVNIAPASTIPTAVTTASGKLLESFNSTKIMSEFRERLEAALDKYGKEKI